MKLDQTAKLCMLCVVSGLRPDASGHRPDTTHNGYPSSLNRLSV
ncbi:MAG: hypothetical protein ABSF32_09550 [Ignavibacteria bacterium]